MIYSQIPTYNGNLREHQIEAKGRIFEAWDQYDSIMLQMPTGSGKTYLFTSLINDLLIYYKAHHLELNIVIVAHRMELLEQISNSLSRYNIPHGFIQGNRQQHLWQRIQVASIQSLLSSKNILNVRRLDFDYIIVDEAHHSLASTYKQLFQEFPDAKKLGVTATPWRFNHESFLTLYQYLITAPQISWFIGKGLLSDFDYVSIKPDSELQRMINNTEIAKTGDFVNAELDVAFNNQRIRAKLYDSYLKFAKGRKGIVYAINRQHAANIASLYNSKGVNTVSIDCETPKEERNYLINRFKAGEIQVLVNVDIFTEGFDCPDVSFIQLARPTRSLALYLQQVGRGLRILPDKEKTVIIDNVGLYNYFGLPDADRKWQYHFKGRDVEDSIVDHCGENSTISDLIPESEASTFDEGDEDMSVIRGSKPVSIKNVELTAPIEQEPPIIEFVLCDYYLVRGNFKHFRVYSLLKKRGKLTQDFGSCLLDYEQEKDALSFTNDTSQNMKMLARNSKAQNIVFFAALTCGLQINEALDLKKINPDCMKDTYTLFDILQAYEGYYRMRE